MEAAKQLMDSGDLTEVQRRRFILHFFQGLSYRQITNREGVHFTSVHKSIEAATAKLHCL
jgi:DNA-directed RNA polymerase specialized sigma24 family protein